MTNGGMQGIQVPVLGQQLGQPDPAVWMQQTILRAAGIDRGGSGVVVTDMGEIRMSGIDVVVVAMPSQIHVVAIVGRAAVGPVMVPWHAVRSLSAP